MDTLKLLYKFGLYHYESEPSSNKLLTKIAHLLTRELQGSEFYKKLLEIKPYEYQGDSDTIIKVDDYIILGCQYEPSKYLITNESFTNLMEQWRKAYNERPNEMSISIDKNKNFTINYENLQALKKTHKITNRTKTKEFTKIFHPSISIVKDTFIEIASINEDQVIFPSNNEQLNLLAYLLTSDFLISNYLEKLKASPHRYYNDRFIVDLIEDKVLINDTIEEIKVLLPFYKFQDLMHEWHLAIKKKPKLIRLYIDNNYNFKIFILDHDS